MKLFFEICKEFFDLLYLPFVSDIIENDIIREDLDNEELDEEKCYKEVSDIEEEETHYHDENQDYEYIQNDERDNHEDIQYNQEKKDIEESIEDDNDDKEICECEFFRQTLSIINARIYKFINDNKSE
jgi:hypothetical protein